MLATARLNIINITQNMNYIKFYGGSLCDVGGYYNHFLGTRKSDLPFKYQVHLWCKELTAVIKKVRSSDGVLTDFDSGILTGTHYTNYYE